MVRRRVKNKVQKPIKEAVSSGSGRHRLRCREGRGMEDGIPLSDLGNQVGAAHGGMGESICDGKVTFYWRSWGDMINIPF